MLLSAKIQARAIPIFAALSRRTFLIDMLRSYSTNLPTQVDLLERYRGLVTLGRIKEDEEQIRVIMQVEIIFLQNDLYELTSKHS